MKNNNININNFGAIKNANIDITALNILIGSNSSGKSFLAKLTHCFNFKEKQNFVNTLITFQQFYKNLNEKNKQTFDEINDELTKYINTKPTFNSKPFEIPIAKIKPLINEGILKYYSQIYTDKIEKQFNEKIDNLINYNELNFRIEIGNTIFTKFQENELKIDLKEFPFKNINNNESGEDNILKVDKNEENILIHINNYLLDIYPPNNGNKIFLNIFGIIATIIIENIMLENSYYIPAERSEIVTDRKLLTRFLQDNSNISKNQSDILANIQQINPHNKGEYYDIACELDEEISKFFIEIEDNGLYNDIIYINPKNNEKTSSNTLSTSIHEIALISIYLKYILKKGDLLIIEEPEAHLHPKNQRILVKYLVKLINNGLKIMITTHSDYILDQINNLVRLNDYPKEKLKKLNYSKSHVIPLDKINIFFFKNIDEDSFICEKIHIDKTGFSEDNFSKITDELYDETITIINTQGD